MDFQTKMHDSLLLFLVQKAIFCPYTGKVLDIRTCAYLTDADGDPALVMSPESGQILAESGLPKSLVEKGFSLVVR